MLSAVRFVMGMLGMLGMLMCATAEGGIIKGPYTSFEPSDGAFGGSIVLHSDSGTLTGLNTVLESYNLYLVFKDSTLSGTINGSLTLNNNSTPFQSLSGLQNAHGTLDGVNYDYTLSFGSSSGGLIGLNPNALWTLRLEDPSGAGTLVSWSLDITAVPEPVNVALGIFAGVFVVGGLCRTERARDWLHRCRANAVRWVDAV
jgi:hypothetical protein